MVTPPADTSYRFLFQDLIQPTHNTTINKEASLFVYLVHFNQLYPQILSAFRSCRTKPAAKGSRPNVHRFCKRRPEVDEWGDA
ncbi:hypothetical protein MJO28_008893 [Puccinia striiformis f. sp. tritici]|uniref:Uncharacterized protein n=1 Tax=Puccinia striiformis f. sp. tritici TaxID=168172 RepID=A0ACC0EBX1_9BASI|nr:hypothetical protein MJO28_008893 [Puccinia striiformis f. sp. tritici]